MNPIVIFFAAVSLLIVGVFLAECFDSGFRKTFDEAFGFIVAAASLFLMGLIAVQLTAWVAT